MSLRMYVCAWSQVWVFRTDQEYVQFANVENKSILWSLAFWSACFFSSLFTSWHCYLCWLLFPSSLLRAAVQILYSILDSQPWHNHLFCFCLVFLFFTFISKVPAYKCSSVILFIIIIFNIQSVVPLWILNSLTVINSALSILSIFEVEKKRENFQNKYDLNLWFSSLNILTHI